MSADDLDLDPVADDFFDGPTEPRASFDMMTLEWNHTPMGSAQRATLCGTAAMPCTALLCWLVLSLLGAHVDSSPPHDTGTLTPASAPSR